MVYGRQFACARVISLTFTSAANARRRVMESISRFITQKLSSS
jgi:hypothetical protein